MRGVFHPELEALAVFTSLNSRRSSVGTKIPVDFPQLKWEVFVGQNRNSRGYFPVLLRGGFRAGPKFLAVFPSLNARCYSARTKVPGDIYQFESDVFFGQDRNSWRYFPIWARGVIRPEPKFLPVFTNLNAIRFRSEPKFLAMFAS